MLIVMLMAGCNESSVDMNTDPLRLSGTDEYLSPLRSDLQLVMSATTIQGLMPVCTYLCPNSENRAASHKDFHTQDVYKIFCICLYQPIRYIIKVVK
jgi:hypothetical protein